MKKYEYNFFMSYKREEKNPEKMENIDKMYNLLVYSGYSVFKDNYFSYKLKGTANWRDNIVDIINECHFFLIFIDPSYLESKTTLFELDTITHSKSNYNFLIILYNCPDGFENEIKESLPQLSETVFIISSDINEIIEEIKEIYYEFINKRN